MPAPDAVPATARGRVAKALGHGMLQAPAGTWRTIQAFGRSIKAHPLLTVGSMVGLVAASALVPAVGTVLLWGGAAAAVATVGHAFYKAGKLAVAADEAHEMAAAIRASGDAYGEAIVNAAFFILPELAGRFLAGRGKGFIQRAHQAAKRPPVVMPADEQAAVNRLVAQLSKAPPEEFLAFAGQAQSKLHPATRAALRELTVSPAFHQAPRETQLVMLLEALGPGHLKQAQVLAESGKLPPQVAEALKVTQGDLPAMSARALEETLSRGGRMPVDKAKGIYRIGGREYQLNAEAGAKVASTGEVRFARDLATGDEVVIKLRKAAAAPERVNGEFDFMEELVRFAARERPGAERALDPDQVKVLERMLGEFRAGTLEDLNYLNEVQRGEAFQRAYADRAFRGVDYVHASPEGDLIIMKPAEGVRFKELSTLGEAEQQEAYLAYMRGLMDQISSGLFHADPHPGNVFWNPKTKQIQFIDMGSVAEMGVAQKLEMGELMFTMLTRNPDGLARLMIETADTVSSPLPAPELQAKLSQAIARLYDARGARIRPTEFAEALHQTCQQLGVYPKDGGYWLNRTLVTMAGTVKGPAKDAMMKELMPFLLRGLAENARHSPAAIKDSVLRFARAAGMPPTEFAQSLIQILNVQPAALDRGPQALRQVLGQMAAAGHAGRQLDARTNAN